MTIVHLNNGDVRGSLEHNCHVFRGIPYAQPLTGTARWLPPQPRQPWAGVWDARRYGSVCTQFKPAGQPLLPGMRTRYFKAIGGDLPFTEGDDCLLLNVWSPTLDRNARLPVMVYIHGGGFTSGAADEIYTGERYAQRGVVYVAIQYRLGPPGFLHGSGLFKGEFCTDNRGFLDQLLALKWVQENIERFGGDASNVTLFGESAGAFSVFPLAASPMAKGLLRRAIGMGGMAETCAPADDYHVLTRELLIEAGIAAGDGQALAALDKAALMRLQGQMTMRIYRNKDPQRYGYLGRTRVGAMGTATGTPFLPKTPLEMYREGTPNNVDLMLGTCADDGQLFSMILPLMRTVSARMFMSILSSLFPPGGIPAAMDFYQQNMPGADRSRRYDQINNDAFYRMPTIRAAEAHAAGHPGRTWLYQLDVHSAIPGLRAIHGIDVAMLFGKDSPAQKVLQQDEATRATSEQMVDAWTSFAKTGTPRATGLPDWKPYDTQTRATMVFDTHTRQEADWGGELRRFWAQAPAQA